jgi:hypothetical protein
VASRYVAHIAFPGSVYGLKTDEHDGNDSVSSLAVQSVSPTKAGVHASNDSVVNVYVQIGSTLVRRPGHALLLIAQQLVVRRTPRRRKYASGVASCPSSWASRLVSIRGIL